MKNRSFLINLTVISFTVTALFVSNLISSSSITAQNRDTKQTITATVLTPRLTGRCRYGDGTIAAKELLKNAIRRSIPMLGFRERLSVSGLDNATLRELERERKRQGSEANLTELDYAILASANISCKLERYREPFGRSTVVRHIDIVTVQTDLVRISDELLISQGNGSASGSQTGVSNRYGTRGTFSFSQNLLSTAAGSAMAQMKARIESPK